MYKDEVFEGNHYNLSIVYKDTTGTPIDLSPVGTAATLKVAANYNSTVVSTGATNTLDSTGRMDFQFTPANLSIFATEEKDVDLILNVELTLNGEVKTILNGVLVFKRALV